MGWRRGQTHLCVAGGQQPGRIAAAGLLSAAALPVHWASGTAGTEHKLSLNRAETFLKPGTNTP